LITKVHYLEEQATEVLFTIPFFLVSRFLYSTFDEYRLPPSPLLQLCFYSEQRRMCNKERNYPLNSDNAETLVKLETTFFQIAKEMSELHQSEVCL